MNKIISANINGFVFSIDELAYTKLKAYLETVKQKVGNAEIAQDIENRIAELFNEKLREGSSAIFDSDVDEVMEQIGRPEQFGAEEQSEDSKGQQPQDTQATATRKRLYRDADDKVIGGVCSGIAAYFGLDPVVIRLAFAAAFFMFGTGFVLYILLMVIIPKALSPAEKLEMRGEPVDYKNVSRTVEKDFRDAYQRYKPEVKTGFQRFLDILVRVGMVMLVIFVLSVIIPGGFGILSAIGVASWSLPALSAYMFTSQSEAVFILIGLLLFLMVPVFGILWSILRFAFKIKPLNRVVSILLSVIWFAGFCMLAYSTYNTGMQFSQKGRLETEDSLRVSDAVHPTLVLRARSSHSRTRFISKDEDGDEHYTHIRNDEDLREAIDREISEHVALNIVNGFSSKPVIRILRQAHGSSVSEAEMRAGEIDYAYELRDSVLMLDDYFSMGSNQLWRNQKVKITLELPASYRLYIDESCRSMLDIHRHGDEDELTGRYLKVDHRGVRVE